MSQVHRHGRIAASGADYLLAAWTTWTTESSICRAMGRLCTRDRSAILPRRTRSFALVDCRSAHPTNSRWCDNRDIQLLHQQMVERRIREHDAQIRIVGAIDTAISLAPALSQSGAEADDRRTIRDQQPLLDICNFAMRLYRFEIRNMSASGFSSRTFRRRRPAHRLVVDGVDDS